ADRHPLRTGKSYRASRSCNPRKGDRSEQKRRQWFPWNTSSSRATSGMASVCCDDLLVRSRFLDYVLDSLRGGDLRDRGPDVYLETCLSAYRSLSTALD